MPETKTRAARSAEPDEEEEEPESPTPEPEPEDDEDESDEEEPEDDGTRRKIAPGPSAPAETLAHPRHVVDVTGLVLGRAASLIAKRLLDGESIVVVNAEKSVVTGSRPSVLAHYRAARARGSVRSGPHFPRYPDRIFRRTVRGMLPHLKTRGREAFGRLEVYIGVPGEYADRTPEGIGGARARPALRAPLTLEEISRLLGARL